MKTIYLVLANTGTILSRIIKYKTGAEYTHVSLGLNRELTEMYSFGRKMAYVAFIGGFVKEGASFGTYKRFKNTQVSIYEVEITEEQYEKLCGQIEFLKEHRKDYRFNILGMFLAGYNIKRHKIRKYYCAEFVKKMFEFSGIDVSYLPEIIKPEHFDQVRNSKLIYKGLLKEYNKHHENVLKKVTMVNNASKAIL